MLPRPNPIHMRRGISETLWIIVAAIVIMVTALVVLTIFSGGISNVSQFTAAKSTCVTQYTVSCKTTGQAPASWQAKTVRDENGVLTSCSVVASGCLCTKGVAGGQEAKASSDGESYHVSGC